MPATRVRILHFPQGTSKLVVMRLSYKQVKRGPIPRCPTVRSMERAEAMLDSP